MIKKRIIKQKRIKKFNLFTKLIESLINYLITESVLYKTKSNVGLYELQYRDIETAIYKNNELKENFIYSVFNYQSDIHY